MEHARKLQRVRVLAAVGIMVVTLALVLLAPSATIAQPYGPSVQGTLTVSDETVGPGQSITVSGKGFKAASSISLVFESLPTSLGTTSSDASGAFAKQVTIPADAALGSHTITATGPAPDGGTRVLSRAVNVQAQGSSSRGTSDGSLPRTGRGIAVMIVTALAFCAGGTLLVLSVRRRGMVSRV